MGSVLNCFTTQKRVCVVSATKPARGVSTGLSTLSWRLLCWTLLYAIVRLMSLPAHLMLRGLPQSRVSLEPAWHYAPRQKRIHPHRWMPSCSPMLPACGAAPVPSICPSSHPSISPSLLPGSWPAPTPAPAPAPQRVLFCTWRRASVAEGSPVQTHVPSSLCQTHYCPATCSKAERTCASTMKRTLRAGGHYPQRRGLWISHCTDGLCYHPACRWTPLTARHDG